MDKAKKSLVKSWKLTYNGRVYVDDKTYWDTHNKRLAEEIEKWEKENDNVSPK